MLLRQSPATPDPDLFLTMSGTTTPAPEPPLTNPTAHDDEPNSNNNETDDIWGSPSAPSPTQPHVHPSDIPRLQHDHTTVGYRDGITAAKALSVQPGFDEGFGLGATIGARAGELLGVLEGIVSALASSRPDETQRLAALLETARKDLSVPVIFGQEYWDEDGTWKYHVPEPVEEGGGGGVVFADVAAAHPLLARWEGAIKAEAARYAVDWDALRDEAAEERRRESEEEGVAAVVERREEKGTGGGKGVLEW